LIKKLILLAIIIALFFWLRTTDYIHMVTFENLKANGDIIRNYVHGRYVLSALIYIAGYSIFTGLALPGAVIISLCGGYVFGVAGGLTFSVIGATIGAVSAFFLARYFLGNWLNTKYADQLAKFNQELKTNGHLYMLTLRLIPIFPFFLINLMAGLTGIRFSTFLWTTFFGIIPGGFVFIYAGSRLSEVSSVSDIFSGKMLSAFVFLGLLMLLPVAYNKLIKKR